MADIVSTEDVLHAMQLGERERLEVDDVVAAVNALIINYKGDRDDWPSHWKHGAKMLAMRIYRRRDSPGGVEALGELGPVYVSRNDPDLAQLLEIGRYANPVVG
jgi:hypothetical protein|nr:MAG TPA: head to tail adaptor [Caudoviricetes sp.]